MSDGTRTVTRTSRPRRRSCVTKPKLYVAHSTILYIANPSPDSDDSEDDHIPKTPIPTFPCPSDTPTRLTTNHQPSNPPLSSLSSTSTLAVEFTPTPNTPGLSTHFSGHGSLSQDPANSSYTNEGAQISTSRTGKIPQPPFDTCRPPQPQQWPTGAWRTTSSTPDSFTSTSSHGSAATVPDKVLIFITTDSERYLIVDISGTKDAAFIRERIYTKLCIWDKKCQSQFSIFQTEIGAFAIGDALTDERLIELCHEQGDSKEPLKFFVSHSPAPVNEQGSRSSSSLSPCVNTIPPPVRRSYNTSSCASLQPKRLSNSKQGSLSSVSEQLHLEVTGVGYEVDRVNTNRDTNWSTVRSPPQAFVAPLPETSNSLPSPHAARRPSDPLPWPVSVLPHNSRPTSPPSLPSNRTQGQGTDRPPLIDKYGDIVPTPPPPPPLSPNRPTFRMLDDNSLGHPVKTLPVRSGSGTANEREQALPAQRCPGHMQSLDHGSHSDSTMDVIGPPPPRPASLRSPLHIPRERHGSLSDASSSSTTESVLRGNVEDNRDSEGTLIQEDKVNNLNDRTLIASRRPDTDTPLRTHLPSESSKTSPLTPCSWPSRLCKDSNNDGDGGTWKKPPTAETPRPKSILRGPPLKVQIENSTSVRTVMAAGPEVPTPPSQRSASPSTLTQNIVKPKSGSTFTDARDETWAPRPPPEDVYERLGDFFPEHDLDKPVIEASSGDTSPTTAEYPAVPVPLVVTPDKSRAKGKKSIRIVAEEHKKRIDRNSSAYASVLRKRSTKLWGSKLEEVTTVQAKTSLGSSLPEPPPGGPTTFKWVRGELIGRGTYGRVYLALNATTGEMIAVKQVETPQTTSDKNDSRQVTVVQALKLESETLKDLDHPNIVQYLGFEETPSNMSIFLEYVPGGSIGSCCLKHGRFNEEVTKSFTGQIISGLEYLHSRGILHRDLKGDNILVEMSGICKISDFGISKRTDGIMGGASTAMQGTVFFMAPEVIDTQKKGYNFKIDIWSVGCVVLEMWTGKRPWIGDEAVAVIFKLFQSKLPPPVPEDITLSPLADDFRRKCFAVNPEERPTAAELRKHPYLILPQGWVFSSFT